MMKYRHILTFLALLVVVSVCSCEKPVEIYPDPSKEKLVLNGLPSPDKRAFVYFAHSRFFLENTANQPVDVESMVLTVNGTPYRSDSLAHCCYFFPYVFQEGDSVSIDITARGEQVHASTVVPAVPAISGLSIDRFAGPSFNFYRCLFNLNDHAGLDEYYSMTVTVRDSGVRYNEWLQQYDTVDTVHATYFMLPSNAALTGDASYIQALGDRIYTTNIFNDKEIDGQSYPVSLMVLHLVDTNEVQPFKHEYKVAMESMTYDCLRYRLSTMSQSSMFSFFAEQGQVYSNVSHALGIFAGSSKREFSFCPDTLAVGH